MRWSYLLALLACMAVALAWTKDDYEIFDLVSDLEAAEGKSVNFYSHVGVDPSASLAEINRAYRKKSLELHPDKNHGRKDAHERFARLGVIAQILRSPERRERYNFFYKNGVPKWRGVGYLYSRWRPSLLQVLVFLVALTSGLHRLVLSLNYSRDTRRVEYCTRAALSAAGVVTGPSARARAAKEKEKEKEKEKGKGKDKDKANVNGRAPRRRKVKIPMVEGNEAAGYLELVVEGDQVLLPHGDGTYTPLSTLSTAPTMLQTWPFQLSLSTLRRLTPHLPLSLQHRLPPALHPLHSDADTHLGSGANADANTRNGLAPSSRSPSGSVSDDDGVDAADDGDSAGDGISTPTPAPKMKSQSRIEELKRARQKKPKPNPNANGNGNAKSNLHNNAHSQAAEAENDHLHDDIDDDDDDDNDGAAGTDGGPANGEGKKKKGLGRAGGARRRKMAMKK